MSTDDRVAKYLESLNEVGEPARALDRIRKIIQGAAQALSQNWSRVLVDNANVQYPISVGVAPNVASINAQTWPTASQLGEAIAAAHFA